MIKIAIIAPNWLGDAVMSLPLAGFLARNEDIRCTVFATPYIARVFMGIDEVSELCIIPGMSRRKRLWHCSRMLRSLSIEAAVVLPPSFSSAAGVFLSGISRRFGYSTDGRGFLLSNPVSSKHIKSEHLSDSFLRLGREAVKLMRLDVPDSFRAPLLKTFACEQESLDKILNTIKAPSGGFVVVVPGAEFGPAKSWPTDNYRVLVEILSKEITVLAAGSIKEKELCGRITAGIRNSFNIAGRTGMGEFFALLSRASAVVANDSGAPHAAASMGIPVITLFGSTSPEWTAPRGDNVAIIRKPVDCSPCFSKECPKELECFTSIEPGEVVDHVKKLLKKVVDNFHA